ncbi:MAG: hypothetical protein RIE56_14630 [Amphiplicatus sp.]
MPPLVRSILSVLAGLISVIVLSSAADVALSAAGILPPLNEPGAYTAAHWLLAIVYRSVIVVFGCWLAARIAPSRPMRHALILGAIGFVLAIIGLVVTTQTEGMGPLWYPAALVVSALPCAWLGGRLGAGKSAVD